MGLQRAFTKAYPRPCIVEMGGKNPAIVMASADLDEAAEGIMRSAFGFGGQKCSANSRVYVERPVHDELVRLLVEKTEAHHHRRPARSAPTGWAPSPTRPPSTATSRRWPRRAATAASSAAASASTEGDLARGFYVEPTVVGDLPADHRLFRDELFAPFTAVHAVDSLDEALRLSNDVVYGLTAGIYSADEARGRALPGGHRGRRPVRQPAGRRHDRRLAGRPALRRLEGLGLDRQGRPGSLVRGPVPARAEPHHRRLSAGRRPP